MKYVALLSGGKDSCYNLLHCAKNGHELLAAASLGPEPGKEELDSYMYQTVGQDAIELVARALEVPLYRQVIRGNAIEKGSEYGGRNASDAGGVQGDETEDLLTLLSSVKAHHPDIQAVSVGAILSNYQRVRVEHVSRRLGLTPLCYLWQRDQGELLSEMIDAGLEAVLIKVAGIGLTIKHLGKTLAEMHPTFLKLHSLYGAHICGEGGEYESFTLDCPLFKHRIILTEVETVIHSDNDFATVAFLRIKHAVLEPKAENMPFAITIPCLLEDRFDDVRDAVISSQGGIGTAQVPLVFPDFDQGRHIEWSVSSKQVGPWVAVTNVQRSISEVSQHVSLEDEVTECFHILRDCLAEYDMQLSNCAHINIFLSSIDLFARVNTVYATFFGTSPPARACVALDLPHPIQVRLDCIAFSEHKPLDRQALHVQSLSYWAPANIGPYSQAIIADERMFISGQIGLIPSSLDLPSSRSLAIETALASQHVVRVMEALKSGSGGGWDGHNQAAIYWLADVVNVVHVKKAHLALKPMKAPILFLVAAALPKGVLVEKQVVMHTGRCLVTEEDDMEPSLRCYAPIYKHDELYFLGQRALHWEISRFNERNAGCAIVCVQGEVLKPGFDMQRMIVALSPLAAHTLSIRLFYVPSRIDSESWLAIYHAIFGKGDNPPVTCVPCRNISTSDSDDWDYALCILSV